LANQFIYDKVDRTVVRSHNPKQYFDDDDATPGAVVLVLLLPVVVVVVVGVGPVMVVVQVAVPILGPAAALEGVPEGDVAVAAANAELVEEVLSEVFRRLE
jgi:hypothetical protein